MVEAKLCFASQIFAGWRVWLQRNLVIFGLALQPSTTSRREKSPRANFHPLLMVSYMAVGWTAVTFAANVMSGIKLKARARKQSVSYTSRLERCFDYLRLRGYDPNNVDSNLILNSHLVTAIKAKWLRASCSRAPLLWKVRFMRRPAPLVQWQGPVISLLMSGYNYNDRVCTPPQGQPRLGRKRWVAHLKDDEYLLGPLTLYSRSFPRA